MKQAYLIIAHKDDLTFRTLISMLDNENNDIFIHMDKKSKNYDEESIEKMAKKCRNDFIAKSYRGGTL